MLLADLLEYTRSLPEAHRDALGDEGLFVHDTLKPGGYRNSPRRFLAFASTGGDGVHFSTPTDLTTVGPIVMTVPMAVSTRDNVVLGEDVGEFLALGCRFGFFALEQLAYDFDKTTARIEAARDQSPPLRRLSLRFGLRPWKGVRLRLLALERLLPKTNPSP